MEDNSSFLEKTDEELVQLTLKDKEIYQYLMERYEEKLTRYIVRLTGANQEDSEDILQGVFIKAYRNLNSFDTRLKFSSWIYRIAHNESVTHLRKISTRPKTVNSETNSILLGLIKTNLDIEENFDREKMEESLKETIQKLDQKYRDVLILKYIEGKDYKEISDILRKPQGTVATLLKRAKEKLKDEMIRQKSVNKFFFWR